LKDRKVIRSNERYRSVSRTLFQLGAALLAAAAVRVYSDQTFSPETLVWLSSSASLMWTGWLILGLLDSEDV